MDYDDIIYLIALFFSIGFGLLYRDIKDINKRKNVGTIVGLGICLLVSGIHILHLLVFTLINILIVKTFGAKRCHLVSFGFSFLYLIFFRTTIYFGIPYAPAQTNLIIMILTLRLVGFAFELNTAYQNKTGKDNDTAGERYAEILCRDIKPGVVDIVHYSFNYVGLLAGPYYTYRTFYDSLHSNFKDFAPCNGATLNKLAYVPFFASLFLLATYIWPFSYAISDEFYQERSFFYRLWYCVPIFFIFRMRIYIGIILSECACTVTGLGAYPVLTEPKPGAGPTRNFIELRNIFLNPKVAKSKDYDFETIHNIYPYGADFCTTFREAMKHWNMCVQYWLAIIVYKRFPNKKYRTLTTMFVSALWHGVYIGHYFTICSAPFYLLVEDIYVKLYLKDNKKNLMMWSWIIWIWKMIAFSYLSVAFHMLTISRVMHYYNSLYHIGFIIGGIMYYVGYQKLKKHNKEMKKVGNDNSVKVK